jgi:hypothetical protein
MEFSNELETTPKVGHRKSISFQNGSRNDFYDIIWRMIMAVIMCMVYLHDDFYNIISCLMIVTFLLLCFIL